MKPEGNSDAEKPENTSMWKEAENRGILGEHDMVCSYVKASTWEERSKQTFVLLQVASLGHWVKLQGAMFLKKKSFVFIKKKPHTHKKYQQQQKNESLSLEVFKHWPRDHLLEMYYRKYTSTGNKVEINNFLTYFLLPRRSII